MTEGQVGASLQATVSLTLRGEEGQTSVVDLVVDTGFNGCLTLPPAVLQALSMPLFDRGNAVLADGSEITTRLYLVRVVWEGTEKIVIAEETDGPPLIGMELMLDCVLTVEAWNGGRVQITPR